MSFDIATALKTMKPTDPNQLALLQTLSYHHDNRNRLFDTRGGINFAFAGMMKMLVGENDSSLLQGLMLSIDMPEQKSPKRTSIDVSGWDISKRIKIGDDEYSFFDFAERVDRSLALLGPVFLDYITKLSRLDQMHNITVQQPQNPMQPQQFVQERKGFWESFKEVISNIRPQVDREYKHGFALLTNSLFDDFNVAKIKWEEYRSQHWQNMAKVVAYESGKFSAVLFEELEALDDVRMRVLRLNEAGTMILHLEQTNQLNQIANSIVQAANAQMQQQVMAQNRMMSVPNGH